MLDRRDLVKGLLSIPLSPRRLPFSLAAAVPVVTASQPARGEVVTIALAVAALVARIIASANATDGGLMATTVANHQLLMAALDKLNQIQTMLQRIYEAIAKLPDEIDRILTLHETRAFHGEVSSVILGYQELLRNKDPAQPDEAWIKSASTQVRLRPLLNRLQQARQNLKVRDLADPATALVIAPAGFVENGLLNLLQTPKKEIQNTLIDVYIQWLDVIANSKHVGSAAQYTLAAAQRHRSASVAAAQTTVGKALNFPAEGKMVVGPISVDFSSGRRFSPGEKRSTGLACGGLNDFTAGYEGSCEPGGPPGHGGRAITADRRPVDPDKLAAVFGSPDPDVKTMLGNPKALEDNGWIVEARCTKGKDPRYGLNYRITRDVSLTEYELKDADGTPTGVMLWQFVALPDKRGTVAERDSPGCEVVTEDVNGDHERAYRRIGDLSAFKTGDRNFTQFDQLIDRINLERARFAFGIEALSVAQTARDQLERIIRSFG